jgi:hypothetical protein
MDNVTCCYCNLAQNEDGDEAVDVQKEDDEEKNPSVIDHPP